MRGVNCDGVMRTLLQRGLIEEAGTEPETGAILYTTTNYFLERMGLRGLDELPELAPFLPEAAEAIEAETQEGLPSFDPDAPGFRGRRRQDGTLMRSSSGRNSSGNNGGSRGGNSGGRGGSGGGRGGYRWRRRQAGTTRRPAGRSSEESRARRSGATTWAPAPPRRAQAGGPARPGRGGAKGGRRKPLQRGRSVPATSREYETRAEERNRERYAGKKDVKLPKTFPGAEQEGERLQKVLARAGYGSGAVRG